ncbi:UNVERIFIED_CONTAM: Coiled-coil domain-containing protein 12 [Sesamum radiatum]|uniref:Coiled-coil domain-containing protein 12 n=1 Tax=Sesamum radiatum TaxID=300843 RepID=A0AAW2S0G3_SESRA
MGGGEEESVEAAAAARRERLRALKAAQELLNTPDDNAVTAKPQDVDNQQPVEQLEQEKEDEDEDENDKEANVHMKFRNYLPHDKQLQEGKLAPPVLPKFEDPVLAAPPPEEKKEDPFLNIAPKKPNWDLRRDVQKRLDKLERRTQKAMLILMNERKQGGDQEKTQKMVEKTESQISCAITSQKWANTGDTYMDYSSIKEMKWPPVNVSGKAIAAFHSFLHLSLSRAQWITTFAS